MDKKNTAAAVGGTKKKVIRMLLTAGAFVLFVLYMVPFVLVLINSFKRKVNIIKFPLNLVDDMGPQFINYKNAFINMNF